MTAQDFKKNEEGKAYPLYVKVLSILGSVLLFIFSIQLISSSIRSFGYSTAEYMESATSNPFVGLFIGLLTTALLQSSSTTTTITVAAVASGSISISGAIPIILGANIGTTITSTIVSMGYITRKGEFKKAVSAGTIHDIFNIIMVVIIFPLEIKYHLLQNTSHYLSQAINLEGMGIPRISFSGFFGVINDWLIGHTNGLLMLLCAAILLFVCIKFISSLLYNILIGKTKQQFETTVFSNTIRSFGWGLFLTSIVQSSSMTTSLIVPLVATSKVKLRRAFQFILGANIGTTLTALLAATFQSEAAIQLAMVHLLFNLIGVVVFLIVPRLEKLPIYLAEKLAETTLNIRIIGFSYILLTFFLVPFTLIYLSQEGKPKDNSGEVIIED